MKNLFIESFFIGFLFYSLGISVQLGNLIQNCLLKISEDKVF